jgi:hypothetical protein
LICMPRDFFITITDTTDTKAFDRAMTALRPACPLW